MYYVSSIMGQRKVIIFEYNSRQTRENYYFMLAIDPSIDENITAFH